VDRLVLYGSYANGAALAPHAVQQSLVSMFRAHWGLGSRIMTELFIPDGDPEVVRWFTRLQREACTGDVAAALLDLCYRADLRDSLGSLDAPTLVLHRRRDRVIPFESGRELAALIPGARLQQLDGRWHQPWLGDTGAVLRPACRFLGIPSPDHAVLGRPEAVDAAQLTTREAEVLRLVAEGLNDTEIAAKLLLSRHTVHRHIANIRLRLGYSSRAAAAAYATRLGLI
jgi:DNA-binding CsgD family transcriptional regulator